MGEGDKGNYGCRYEHMMGRQKASTEPGAGLCVGCPENKECEHSPLSPGGQHWPSVSTGAVGLSPGGLQKELSHLWALKLSPRFGFWV